MEHNVEELIRQKVGDADHLAVSWRKEWVWEHIDLAKSKKSMWRVYYAAASFVLTGIVLVYFLQRNEDQSTIARIKALEAKISEAVEQRRVTEGTALTELRCADIPPVIIPQVDKIAHRTIKTETIRELPEVVVPNDLSPVLEDITVTESEVLPAIVLLPPAEKPRVLAIIGIVPGQPEVVVKTSTRKFRLHLFKSSELDAEYLSPEENKFITAKLK